MNFSTYTTSDLSREIDKHDYAAALIAKQLQWLNDLGRHRDELAYQRLSFVFRQEDEAARTLLEELQRRTR